METVFRGIVPPQADADKQPSRPNTAADTYKKSILSSCKTDDQRSAFNVLTNFLTIFYCGPSDPVNRCFTSKRHLLIVVGVLGSAKSWVISAFRKWTSLKFSDHTFKDTGIASVFEGGSCDTATSKVINILSDSDEKSYGRAPVLAYSGGGAGVVKGHTIHRALDSRE